ncbi:hypothetical protein TRICI_002403 [Trichomonascus ciferrii]|uniref:Glycosyl transferase family 25 domain-containing protein n=1 Tax=Trichomonascus ciferrii TaxID=44093 RepID=A0A642VC31_9ASCO|nr:hypothetical protein TRICI_002403 [Trichomonascus ciferrii]
MMSRRQEKGRLRLFDFKVLGILLFLVAFIQLACLGLKRQPFDLWFDSPSPTESHDNVFNSAGNATLGFQSIRYINLPTMFDKADALRMQSASAGLKMFPFDAIGKDMIQENGKGLPPSSAEKELKPEEKACLRSHVELWHKMVEENIQTMLILEADAAWDVNIRDIHTRIARGLHTLYSRFNPNSTVQPTPDDPYNSRTWDLISFGSCHDDKRFSDHSVIIKDPDSPLNQSYYDTPLTDQRVVRKAGYLVCTTGYALTLQGAKRLLLRFAIDLNKPIDILIADMILSGQLDSISVYPPTIAQWTYVSGIGAENLGSSIQNVDADKSKNAEEIWKSIYDEQHIWDYKKSFQHARLRNSAFEAFRRSAYPDFPQSESHYT